jgi:hypothetical protein
LTSYGYLRHLSCGKHQVSPCMSKEFNHDYAYSSRRACSVLSGCSLEWVGLSVLNGNLLFLELCTAVVWR